MTADRLWALTSYFNPLGYRTRLSNYRRFRAALAVPLLTVEMGYEGRFELEAADADILIQVPGNCVMWQKERLLNIGLAHLPREIPNVAWLDCDILFERSEWMSEATRLIEHQQMPLVQLFDSLYDLPQDYDGGCAPSITGFSVSSLVTSGTSTLEDFRPPTTRRLRRCAFGLAWAASRSLLSRHGFYDAMILGSGDRAMACAAFGRFDDAIYTARLAASRARHYLAWAKPFHTSVGGRIGCVAGALHHLWHGDLADRQYVERHVGLAMIDFDPQHDIRVDVNGTWAWASDKPHLHQFVREYFAIRQEDGRPAPPGGR